MPGRPEAEPVIPPLETPKTAYGSPMQVKCMAKTVNFGLSYLPRVIKDPPGSYVGKMRRNELFQILKSPGPESLVVPRKT